MEIEERNILKNNRKAMKLDGTDMNILGLLRANGRFTAKEIARKLRISREVVQYRIKNYEDKGLISNWDCTLNHLAIGQQNFWIDLSLNYGSPQALLQKIAKIKNCVYLATSNLNSLVLIFVITKDISELINVTEKIKKICNNHINEINLSLVTKGHTGKGHGFNDINITRGYSKSSFQKYFLEGKKPFLIEKMKPAHHKVLNALSHNIRAPILSIAKKANLSVNTTIKTIIELIKWGIIIEWCAIANYSAIGLDMGGILIKTKSCNFEDERKIWEYLKNSDKTYWVSKYLGKYDYGLNILYKDHQTILDFIKEIKTKFGNKISKIDFYPIDETYVWRDYSSLSH